MKCVAQSFITVCLFVLLAPLTQADALIKALQQGKPYVNMRLRHESVDQNNALADANALTLRTRLGYKTGSLSGFSATLEMEDSRVVLGQNDFTVGPTNFNPGQFSVIADPETTELDQALIAYKSKGFTASLGRQLVVLGNQRFVGHVGWRQDRQTFDGVSTTFSPNKSLSVKAIYLTKRNRLFAEQRDVDTDDILLNIAYNTRLGKWSGYHYALEADGTRAIDTTGVRFNGKHKQWLYTVELASQSNDNNNADTHYHVLELGMKNNGVTTKIGHEVLGADGTNGSFQTPLGTVHKFNGWADLFLSTPSFGLEDTYISVAGNVSGIKLAAIYHTYAADESSTGINDLGSEINLLAVKKWNKHYTLGLKYADYSADDFGVDTQKIWLWFALAF